MDRFVAGEDAEDAVAAMRQLTADGLTSTVDVLGEDTRDAAGAERIKEAYLSLLRTMAATGTAHRADVSVKLSALGQSLSGSGEKMALAHAHDICSAAAELGATVTLDMEDHTTVDSTLAIGEELRKEFPTTGTVLQANLRRTESDLATLGGGPTRVRLVKGAYKEPDSVAFQRKPEVDAAYERGIASLAASLCYPMVATHDPYMLHHAKDTFEASGRSSSEWELQMLYGVRTDLQRQNSHDGYQVRVYIPFGTDWYAYFMRRLAERPANVAFFLRALAHRPS